MDQSQALLGFGALSQENRLEIVRLLVRAGPDGLPAGEIAEAVGISPSNLSFHLKELENAEPRRGRRELRSMIYTANYEALRGLGGFPDEGLLRRASENLQACPRHQGQTARASLSARFRRTSPRVCHQPVICADVMTGFDISIMLDISK